MRRIYVASSWRNNHQPFVVEVLRAKGHRVYDFRNPEPGCNGFRWSEIDPAWREWHPVTYRQALDHPIAIKGYRRDWKAMQWADTCVLVLPCGRSAHLEAGYFVAAQKTLLIYMPVPVEPELMYKMADGICVTLRELVGRLEARPEEGK